jgi:hypothetical protein
VAVVFADQILSTVERLSAAARLHVYSMGVAVPVYAATVSDTLAAFKWCDVVAGLSQWTELAENLKLKLAAGAPKTDVIWCDPAASSAKMHNIAADLAKLGLNVEFYDDVEKFVNAASEDTAAVVTSGRGVPFLREIRERLHDRPGRPLYWVVSLSATTAWAYDNGADGAVVCDNTDLQFHKSHIMDTRGNDPWMWQVVIGDLSAIVHAIGVTGVGGIQWAMPKQFDDLSWRCKMMPLLAARCTKVFLSASSVGKLQEHKRRGQPPYAGSRGAIPGC